MAIAKRGADGVVFDITQGFVYGHLAKDKTHNCYVDVIGTRGICRMRHDFQNATIECHGVHTTVNKTALFNDKKLDVMCDVVARSVAKFTSANSTPAWRPRAFCTRAAQEPHVIPDTFSSRLINASAPPPAAGFSTARLIGTSSSPPRPVPRRSADT